MREMVCFERDDACLRSDEVHRTLRLIVSTAFTLALFASSTALGQAVGELRPTCTSCRVELNIIATLRPPGNAGRFFHHIIVTQVPSGRFIVSPGVDPYEILVYSPTGEFEGTFGRAGSGPGEFRLAEVVISGAGDSIIVFDGLARRMTVLTSKLQVARVASIGLRAQRAIALGPGAWVVESQLSSPDRFGMPIEGFMDKYPQMLRFNLGRHVVQVFDCAGRVTGQMAF
jgi:hypothetical protein